MMENIPHHGAPADGTWLTGQLLIAMPTMPDARFAHSVIYICSHGPHGTMGLVLNRLYREANFESLLEQLNIEPTASTPVIDLHFGGPVETGRGFVLHSSDYLREGTIRVDDNVALSATIEVLQNIARGEGPDRFIMALGYTGWGAGQLESEMKSNGWLTAPADDAILYDSDVETKWERVLGKMGITPMLLSTEVGHA